MVYVPDSMLDDLAETVSVTSSASRHHAMLSLEKAQRLLGFPCRCDLRSGHEHTHEWLRDKGYAHVDGPMIDPMLQASWNIDGEAAIARQVLGG